jgi:prepilin-type N-terminal cleavage/methylation domain-containing protein
MISLKQRLDTRLAERNQANTQQQRNQGFTIVELLIVIVVIAILALLVITTYGGIQAKARNAQRQSDITALQTQIEAYYAGGATAYPTLSDMDTSTWMTTNMKSLDQVATQDPSETCAVNAQVFGGSGATQPCLTGAPGANHMSYVPAGAVAGACQDVSSGANPCINYTLTATLENPTSTYAKTALD